ncbi:MAG TPA: glycosyltransferase family 39 protein [Vicinamibacteria bacterium]
MSSRARHSQTARTARTLLLLVAATAYLAAFLYLRPDRAPETWEPGEIAAHLLASEGYSLHRFTGDPEPSANQEPLYPLLLAAFFRWAPAPYVSLLVFQVLAWLAASIVLARLARRCLDAPERATALAVALWPPLVVYVLAYHPLWLRATMLVLTLAAALRYRDRPGARRAIELGAVLGLATLARTTFLALPLAIVPWSLRRERSPLFLTHGALMLVTAALVLSPWLVRNRIVLGAWIPGTTTSGYALFIGNHPGANGVMDDEALGRINAGLPAGFYSLPEADRDRLLRDRALTFLFENPGRGARLYLAKLFYLWTWRPGVGHEYSPGRTRAYLILWSVTLPLILLGWRLASRRPGAEYPGLPLGTWAFLSLIYAAFAVNMRFRFESEALLVPYAVLAVTGVWRGRLAARR